MKLRYRNYTFGDNLVDIDRNLQTLVSETGQPYAQTDTWQCRGEIIGSGQTTLGAVIAGVAAALGQPYGDLYFLADDGTPIYSMINAQSLNGVRINNLRIPTKTNAYATSVPFEFEAQATFLYNAAILGVEALILHFNESLKMSGGGPRYGFMELINGSPVPFVSTPQTVMRATQQGQAIGLGGYPVIPGPFWPADLLPDQTEIEKGSPKRNGVGYWEYPVSWRYEFAAIAGLIGSPGRFI